MDWQTRQNYGIFRNKDKIANLEMRKEKNERANNYVKLYHYKEKIPNVGNLQEAYRLIDNMVISQ